MPEHSQEAVTGVVDAYRHCLVSRFPPYQFVLTTEDFFRRYVITNETGNIAAEPYGVGGELSPSQQSMIPSQVQGVIQLDDGRAIAVLESNPEWVEASGLKAGILLVNQNGQWLIDQLVLVQDS